MRNIITILCISSFSLSLSGQTCCSGGVPFSSNIGFQSSGQGSFQYAVSYEQNNLHTLYNESNVLEFNNRERITRSYLLRLGYGVTDKISLEVLLPYINQKRNITQNNGQVDEESSSGIGDFLFLVKYDLVKSPSWNINIGSGLKFPTGSTSITNKRGLLLVNDMQPGSASTDFLGRISITYNPAIRPSMTFNFSGIANLKGSDNTYLGSQLYKFGNEVQLISHVSDQWFLGNKVIYPAFGLRFRYAKRDVINHNPLENTGGRWIFGKIGSGVDFYRNHRLSLSLELPFYTHVEGTQLGPDHIVNITYSSYFTRGVDPKTIMKNPL